MARRRKNKMRGKHLQKKVSALPTEVQEEKSQEEKSQEEKSQEEKSQEEKSQEENRCSGAKWGKRLFVVKSSDEDGQAPPDSKDAASDSEQLSENGEVKEEEKEKDISKMIVKCSSCSKKVNHHFPDHIEIHPDLKVLICKKCAKFYGNGEFSEDEDGDKYCRWCAQGGKLYGCDFCANGFCVDCIHRNFGRAEFRRVREDKWKCYICDPSKLQEKMNFCTMIVDYSNAKEQKKRKKKRKPNSNFVPCTIEELQLESNVPSKWLPKAVDCLLTSASRFDDRINKLKNFSILGKSTSRIVSKLEKVVDGHKAEIKEILENINEKHNKYKREKLSQLMKPEINDSKDKTHSRTERRTSRHVPAIPDQSSTSDSADDRKSSQKGELTQLKRTAKRPRRSSDGSGTAPSPASKKQKKKPAVNKTSSSSESWTLSSGEEEVVSNRRAKTIKDKSKKKLLASRESPSSEEAKKQKEDSFSSGSWTPSAGEESDYKPNNVASKRRAKTNDDTSSGSSEGDVFSDSSGIQESSSKKKKASGKNRKDSNEDEELPSAKEDSDEDPDDFVATKPKKGDKPLKVPLVKKNKKRSDDKARDKDKKAAQDNKKKTKRIKSYSDESSMDSEESGSSSTSSSPGSDSRKKKKGKPMRTPIKIADDQEKDKDEDEDEDEDKDENKDEDEDKDKDENKDEDKGTPKGRKSIKKVDKKSDKKLDPIEINTRSLRKRVA